MLHAHDVMSPILKLGKSWVCSRWEVWAHSPFRVLPKHTSAPMKSASWLLQLGTYRSATHRRIDATPTALPHALGGITGDAAWLEHGGHACAP